MKKTDIAMIILIASVSAAIAYFSVKTIIGDAGQKPVKVKVANKIDPTAGTPDKTVFGKDASPINPTVQVVIGNESAKEPSSQESGE